MSKEKVLSREDVRLEIERINLEKAKGRLKVACGAVGAVSVARVGVAVVPKAVTFLKGNIMFMGSFALPNYFIVLLLAGYIAVIADSYSTEKAKVREKKIKAGNVGELLTLKEEEEEDD